MLAKELQAKPLTSLVSSPTWLLDPKITEQFGLERTFKAHLVQTSIICVCQHHFANAKLCQASDNVAAAGKLPIGSPFHLNQVVYEEWHRLALAGHSSLRGACMGGRGVISGLKGGGFCIKGARCEPAGCGGARRPLP